MRLTMVTVNDLHRPIHVRIQCRMVRLTELSHSWYPPAIQQFSQFPIKKHFFYQANHGKSKEKITRGYGNSPQFHPWKRLLHLGLQGTMLHQAQVSTLGSWVYPLVMEMFFHFVRESGWTWPILFDHWPMICLETVDIGGHVKLAAGPMKWCYDLFVFGHERDLLWWETWLTGLYHVGSHLWGQKKGRTGIIFQGEAWGDFLSASRRGKRSALGPCFLWGTFDVSSSSTQKWSWPWSLLRPCPN